MVKPSDSNPNLPNGDEQPSTTAASAQQQLQQGIAALKERDYDTALACFQKIERAFPAFRRKAQMGMVQVYHQQGKVHLARSMCQDLLLSSSSRVRQWAQQTLSKLPEPSSDAMPVEASSPTLGTKGVDADVDRSGFVPLDATTESSGRVLGPGPSLPASPVSGESDPSSLKPSSPVERKNLSTASPEISPQESLFHYQQLNQQPFTSPDPEAAIGETAVGAVSPPASSSASVAHPSPEARPRPTGSIGPGKPRQGLSEKPYRLWGIQVVTAIATLWVIHWGLHQGLQVVNAAIRLIRWPIQLRGFAAFDRPHLSLLGVLGVLMTLASPWLLDRWLAWFYGQQPLSSRQLQTRGGAALRLLRQVCRQRGWQMPTLRVLPGTSPLCFSYGWSPRTARIVVSQGLLETLTEDELTALYAYELAHIANWDLPVLSGLSFLLLVLHSGYWHLAQWGGQQPQTWLRGGMGLIANGLYGVFWLLRKFGLWLSRARSEACDRVALGLSRQPGHQQQVLLTLTRQIAHEANHQGHLHPLLTSLDLLMPLSPSQAISPGSFLDQVGLPRLVAEDCLNPYRYWLVANNSHAILGERLLFLEQWARYQGQPSLGLTLEQLQAETIFSAPSQLTVRDLILQNSPLLGLIGGGSIALGLWFMGGVLNRLNWQQVSWLYQDTSVLRGGLLIGLGIGTLVRVNTLFPASVSSRSSPDQSIRVLFQRKPTLPVEGKSILLEGTLLGSPGLTNALCQNLFLQQEGGIVQLKATSPLDWWRGFSQPQHHPIGWLGRQTTVAGWQRRGGGRLWVDIASLQVPGKPAYQVHSPLWTTGLGLTLCLWGIWQILTGG